MNITEYLAVLTEVVTAITTMFTSVMSIFMEPPLSVFLGMGIFLTVVGVVGRYLIGKKRRK